MQNGGIKEIWTPAAVLIITQWHRWIKPQVSPRHLPGRWESWLCSSPQNSGPWRPHNISSWRCSLVFPNPLKMLSFYQEHLAEKHHHFCPTFFLLKKKKRWFFFPPDKHGVIGWVAVSVLADWKNQCFLCITGFVFHETGMVHRARFSHFSKLVGRPLSFLWNVS